MYCFNNDNGKRNKNKVNTDMHVYLDTFMHECIEWQQYIEYNNIQGTTFLLKFDTKRIGSKIYAGGE